MEYGTLNQRHPICTPDLYARYDALYRGGEAFRAKIRDFLLPNPLEGRDGYELRLKEAAYRSYVGPITDFFAAQLFSAPFQIRAGENGKTEAPKDLFYGEFREDCDLLGTDLAAFIKARFLEAMVCRSAWWVAEMPSDDADTPAVSRLEWEKRDLGRAKLSKLAPSDVLDFEVDDSGQRLWILTHETRQRRGSPRDKRLLVTETWKIYDDADVETFTITYDPKRRRPQEHDEIPSAGKRPHGFARIPVVELRLPEGLWLLNRAAAAQVEHFRVSAALGWALRRTCYPLGVFRSQDGQVPATAAGMIIPIRSGCDGKDAEEFAWVAPPATSFEVLTEEIKNQRTEIYRVCQQMAAAMDTSAAALDRSGDSKAADMAATEICLYSYAGPVKSSIEDTFELVSDARGDIDVHFSVEGMTSFNLENLTGEMNNIKTALDLGIDSATLKKELEFRVADILLPDASQPTKDKIREELEEAAKKPKPEPAPPVALPGQLPPKTLPGQVPGTEQKPQPTAT